MCSVFKRAPTYILHRYVKFLGFWFYHMYILFCFQDQYLFVYQCVNKYIETSGGLANGTLYGNASVVETDAVYGNVAPR